VLAASALFNPLKTKGNFLLRQSRPKAGSLIVPCVALLDKRLWGFREKLTGGGKNANISSELSVGRRRPPSLWEPPLAMVLRINGSDKMAGEEFFTAEAQRAQRKTTYE